MSFHLQLTTPRPGFASGAQTGFGGRPRIPRAPPAGGDTRLAGLNNQVRAGGDFGTVFQKDILSSIKPMQEGFEQLRGKFERDVGDTGQERGRLRTGLSSAVAQKFQNVAGPNAFAGNIEQLTRKAKARSQIANRGEAAINNQQLKDRIMLARQGIQRQGTQLNILGNSSRIRQGIDTAARNAKDSVSSAIGGALGSIAGGLTAGIKNKFNSSIDPFANATVDQGGAASDFLNVPGGDFNVGSLDPSRIGQGPTGTVYG